MRVTILAVGRLKDGADRDLLGHYLERLNAAGRGVSLGPLAVVEIPEARAQTATLRCEDEAQRLIKHGATCDGMILLDVAGRQMSSETFAAALARMRDEGTRSLGFLIGGPDGHGQAARAKASLSLSLGPMTLPHGLARIVLAEQLYRAATILSGHPYHRG